VLSSYVDANPFSAAKHLDDPHGYSVALRNADATHFHNILKQRREVLGQFHMAVSELYCLRWGPLELPIFTTILNLLYAYPGARKEYLDLTQYLAGDCKVPVDAVDLAGASALHHAISTKPYFDVAFATIMLDNRAKINRQDRHGRTAAHYIVGVTPMAGSAADLRASEAMAFFISKGGNPAIPDGSGNTVMSRGTLLRKQAPKLLGVLLGKEPSPLASPTSPVSQRPLSMRTTSYENNPMTRVISSSRPAYTRAPKSHGSTTSTASAGSVKVGKLEVVLPGVTCPCQRRGMWRVCCGVPPDLEAMNKALPLGQKA